MIEVGKQGLIISVTSVSMATLPIAFLAIVIEIRHRITCMQWFRLYNETLNDPKVQSLDGDTFKAWINLLCVASQCNATCNVTDVTFHLRCSQKEAENYIIKLVDAGLFHNNGDMLTPHNWEKRQYKSDTSNERVKKHREEKKNKLCNVTSPLPVTPPDQIRIRTEHIQNQNQPLDFRKNNFDIDFYLDDDDRNMENVYAPRWDKSLLREQFNNWIKKPEQTIPRKPAQAYLGWLNKNKKGRAP